MLTQNARRKVIDDILTRVRGVRPKVGSYDAHFDLCSITLFTEQDEPTGVTIIEHFARMEFMDSPPTNQKEVFEKLKVYGISFLYRGDEQGVYQIGLRGVTPRPNPTGIDLGTIESQISRIETDLPKEDITQKDMLRFDFYLIYVQGQLQ